MQIVLFLSSVLLLERIFFHEFFHFSFFYEGQVTSTCNGLNVVLKADIYTADVGCLDGFIPPSSLGPLDLPCGELITCPTHALSPSTYPTSYKTQMWCYLVALKHGFPVANAVSS